MAHERCPKCAGGEIRSASGGEMTEFYGERTPFVLHRPRKCKSCGYIWELAPTKAGAALMVLLSACGILLGCAMFVVLVIAVVGGLLGNKIPGGAFVFGGAGIPCFIASRRALKKYMGQFRPSRVMNTGAQPAGRGRDPEDADQSYARPERRVPKPVKTALLILTAVGIVASMYSALYFGIQALMSRGAGG